MDYCLGHGDGTAAMLSGHPDVDIDGDGELDGGVRLDLDGDGVFDDALTDLDGDGVADHASFDLDDGTAIFTDDGSGTWAMTPAGPGAPRCAGSVSTASSTRQVAQSISTPTANPTGYWTSTATGWLTGC